MRKIFLASLAIPLVGCVNYKDTFTKNANSTAAYVANSAVNTISQYAVDATTLKLTANGTVTTGTTPTQIVMHPNAKFVYAVNRGSDTISVFAVSTATRKLTLASTFTTGVAPTYLIFNSAGTFAYLANAVTSGNSTLLALQVSTTTGALTLLGTYTPGTDQAGCAVPVDISIVGTGLYLACNSEPVATNYVLRYTMDTSTGGLTVQPPHTNFAATAGLAYTTPNPSGGYIYGSQTDGVLGIIALNSDGTFGALTSGPTNPGTNAVGIYLNAAGTLAWVINKGSNTIVAYSISGATFSQQSVTTVGTAPTAMTFANSYKNAYVVNSGDNTVSLYSVNATTGELTAPSTIATGTTPTNLVGY